MKKSLIVLSLVSSFFSASAQMVSTHAGQPGTPGFNTGTETIANASFTSPWGIAIIKTGSFAGYMYVAEHGGHKIRLLTPTSIYTRGGWASDPSSPGAADYINQNGINSRFNAPSGIDIDASGNLYVADYNNHVIRKVSAFTSVGNVQAISTLAGEAQTNSPMGGYEDATGSNARFLFPTDVAVAADGNIYVADAGNHCIRKITPNGVVTTLAGNGFEAPGFRDGNDTNARFYNPIAIEVLDNNTLLVADAFNHRIRAININTGAVTTYAGSGTRGALDGSISTSQFRTPSGLAVDAFGSVYVAEGFDGQANTIRKISNGQVKTIAGEYQTFGTTDEFETLARFYRPFHMSFDETGKILYVVDQENHSIRKIDFKPIINFSASSTTPVLNQVITLNSQVKGEASNYTWTITPSTFAYESGFNANSANPQISFTATGTYEVKLEVSNDFGSDVETKTAYITVGSSGTSPVASFDVDKLSGVPNLTLFSFTDKSTNNPTSWEWTFSPNNVNFSANSSATSQNPQCTFTATGIYEVKLKASSANGNSTSPSKFININPVSVKEVNFEELFNLYPNPNNGKFTLSFNEVLFSENFEVNIYDINGKLIKTEKINSAEKNHEFDLSQAAKGIYLIKIKYDDHISSSKIIIQ